MASNYPTSIDSFTDPLVNSPLNSPSHALQHQDVNDAVEKLETKLGIGSAPASSALSGARLVANGSGSTSWQRDGICTSTTRPASPYSGQEIYETDTNLKYVWNGSAWYLIGGGTAVGNSGLVYITGGTLSAANIIFVNNCFSSAYTNYKVMMFDMGVSTQMDVRFNMRRLGSNETTGQYYSNNLFIQQTTVTNAAENIQTSWRGLFTGNTSGVFNFLEIDLYHPFTTQPTMAKQQMSGYDQVSGFVANRSFTGFLNTSLSYDGFALTAAAGQTVSSKYVVYGYRTA